jgi:hypothetical protein
MKKEDCSHPQLANPSWPPLAGHPKGEPLSTSLQTILKLLHFLDFRFEIWKTPSRTHCREVFLDLALYYTICRTISSPRIDQNAMDLISIC